MEAEVKVIDFKQIHFSDLDTKVKEHVVKFLQSAIEEVLGAHTKAKEVFAMLDQIDPFVMFMKWSNGDKTFTIDESDERLSKFLADSYKHQLEIMGEPDLLKKILKSAAERVDGTPRMKIS